MTLPADVSLRIHRRDDFKCRYCGYDGKASLGAFRNICVDHFIPKKHGGTDEDQNLVTACRACNSDKATNKFEKIEDAQRWLRLYRTECSGFFYKTFVVGTETFPSTVWSNAEREKRRQERFAAGEDEAAA